MILSRGKANKKNDAKATCCIKLPQHPLWNSAFRGASLGGFPAQRRGEGRVRAEPHTPHPASRRRAPPRPHLRLSSLQGACGDGVGLKFQVRGRGGSHPLGPPRQGSRLQEARAPGAAGRQRRTCRWSRGGGGEGPQTKALSTPSGPGSVPAPHPPAPPNSALGREVRWGPGSCHGNGRQPPGSESHDPGLSRGLWLRRDRG